MKIEIKAFDPKDYQKAVQFAVKGMSFDRYSNNKTVINMYAKNFYILSFQRLHKPSQLMSTMKWWAYCSQKYMVNLN